VQGILVSTPLVGNSGARLSNLYQFAPTFLAFVRQLKESLKTKKLKFSSMCAKVKAALSATLALCGFAPTPLHQNDFPLRQIDVPKKKRTPSRKTERVNSGGAENAVAIKTNKLSEWIVAAKTNAANGRNRQRLREEETRRETIKNEAKRLAYLSGRQRNDLSGISDFSGQPTVQTIAEALDRLQLKGESNNKTR